MAYATLGAAKGGPLALAHHLGSGRVEFGCNLGRCRSDWRILIRPQFFGSATPEFSTNTAPRRPL